MKQQEIGSALNTLIPWLESWQTIEGAFNGFIIHRTEAKRMNRIHDTAWTQAAMIRGYANLYRKIPEERWRFALQKSAELQFNRLDTASGKYQYAGHEDDRFCSLVHCALANCALLDVDLLLGEDTRNRFIRTV